MRGRVKFENVLSLAYQLGWGRMGEIGGGGEEGSGLRAYALNLPYRYCRWLEAQATSEPIVVKQPRDAGANQKPGTPGDEQTAEFVGRIITRALYEARYENEMNGVIGEVCGRGISWLAIGYSEEALTKESASEEGKDTQSVIVDVLGAQDVEAKDKQEHAEIAEGLRGIASDQVVQAQAGMRGIVSILERASSHDLADYEQETDRSAVEQVRDIRRRVWVRKLRAGEDIFWDATVSDTQDCKWIARRHVWTLAEFRASDMFTDRAKREIHGDTDRMRSGIAEEGQTLSATMMGSDARQAGRSDPGSTGDEEELLVEWFEVYERRPDMKAGGIRFGLCAEVPDQIITKDDQYPYVDDKGYCVIPGFYPFYDFAPIKPTLNVPERTCGTPLVAVGWTQFEKIEEFNRLRVESARKHALRAYQIHPFLKDSKKVLSAFQKGEDGYAFVADKALVGSDGRMVPAVEAIQFSGNTQEIEVQAAREESDWVKVMGMPPAHLLGVGQAETATQEQIGTAAGESEMQSLVKRLEMRMADVCEGLRGLIRAFYDSEDIVALLGADGAQAIESWKPSSMLGDRLEVRFGLRARRENSVANEQIMKAIGLVQAKVDPVTGMPLFDDIPLFEELFRNLGLGKPQLNQTTLAQLQQLAMVGQQVVMAQQAQQQAGGGGPQGAAPGGQSNGKASPAPASPGEGPPSRGNLEAGARRGTVPRPSPVGVG